MESLRRTLNVTSLNGCLGSYCNLTWREHGWVNKRLFNELGGGEGVGLRLSIGVRV